MADELEENFEIEEEYQDTAIKGSKRQRAKEPENEKSNKKQQIGTDNTNPTQEVKKNDHKKAQRHQKKEDIRSHLVNASTLSLKEQAKYIADFSGVEPNKCKEKQFVSVESARTADQFHNFLKKVEPNCDELFTTVNKNTPKGTPLAMIVVCSKMRGA